MWCGHDRVFRIPQFLLSAFLLLLIPLLGAVQPAIQNFLRLQKP